MKKHEHFNAKKPHILVVECDSSFEFSLEHTTRLDEHMGMPIITTHDVCETCFTNYYYEFEGFDSNQVYRCQPSTLKTIQDYRKLLSQEKIISIQQFAPYLSARFQETSECVTLYASLDEDLKRSHHENLISFYEQHNIPLSDADNVGTYVSEEELFTNSRMGDLFEQEFLQQITYPLSKLHFEYNTYHKKIDIEMNIHQVEKQAFFDIYTRKFVSFDVLDLTNIHTIKRNADTHAFCKEIKKKLHLEQNASVNEIHRLFDCYFNTLEHNLLKEVFGKTYDEFVETEENEKEAFNKMIVGMREYAKEAQEKQRALQPEKPVDLNGFKKYDTIQIQQGIYQGMKACIKEIDFNKEELNIVFFGETNSRNVISIKPKECIKI